MAPGGQFVVSPDNACKKPELTRAAKHLRLVDDAQLEDDSIFDMLCDIAQFAANQRGRRAFDGFLHGRLAALDPAERDVAHRMGSAFVLIFRVAERHTQAGLWLFDESLEASAPQGLVIGMRLFETGPCHAGIGIIAGSREDLVTFRTQAAVRGVYRPVHSFACPNVPTIRLS